MENNLNAKNFVLYAAKHYDNPGCESIEEFHDDLNRFKYIKRLFTKYQETGEIKERLVLNHLIALYNLFGAVPTTRMLFFKLEGNWELLKPFLVYLGYMPERLYEIGEHRFIIDSNISLDDEIVNRLRKI
jgi:hypothetical protein